MSLMPQASNQYLVAFAGGLLDPEQEKKHFSNAKIIPRMLKNPE
jgi:hypothetical protein